MSTRLQDLRTADLCTDRAVREFLRVQGGRLECVVAADGTVFAVSGGLSRRVGRALLGLVHGSLGAARLVEVTPLDFAQWKEANRPRLGAIPAASRNPANRTVEFVFGRAVEERASDVYLDVRRDRSVLAFRTYGFRRPFDQLSRDDGLALARSIWALGTNAQFDESGVCDVAFDFEHGGRQYRIRGNSMKEVRGNSVVCRVRDPSFVLPLEDSGYAPVQVRQIARMCRAPGGLILITGETNSGKSTTLASLMSALPTTQKVIEVADPVEVVMDHVSHVEIEHYGEGAEQRLSQNLAALVRQNPDTLVLGEIRDGPSATAAKDMAIQGKRVLTTLHSQSCVAAIPRLVNLGVPVSLLGARAFLAGIVNQNLVPVVCGSCGLASHPDAAVDARYRTLFGERVRFLNNTGCGDCRGGVAGQTLVAEVYPLCLDRTGRANELIGAGLLAELERHMRRDGAGGNGCMSKHQHAATKAAVGQIDPEHTERIIGEFNGEDVEGRCGDLVELGR